MSLYTKYKHLVKLNYTDGKQDCYGLVRRFYRDVFGIELRNYARPIGFDHAGIPLITDNFKNEGFQIVQTNLRDLQFGDGLMMNVMRSSHCNHVGVYVGNGLFLHHLYNQKSTEDPLDTRWKNRILSVVRHPDVAEINKANRETVDIMEFIPPHVRNQLRSAG